MLIQPYLRILKKINCILTPLRTYPNQAINCKTNEVNRIWVIICKKLMRRWSFRINFRLKTLRTWEKVIERYLFGYTARI